MTKILINSGPSGRGWHRLESMSRCAQLYSYLYVLKLPLGDRIPLVRGSLNHVGLAHYYQRIKEVAEGRDPDAFYDPEEAIIHAAQPFGKLGIEMIPVSTKIVQAYMAYYAQETFKVVAVEHRVEATVNVPISQGGSGKNRLFTQRIDLITQDRTGKYWALDHKSAARIDSKTEGRYSISGQFLAMNWFMRGLYGDKFGGIRINFLDSSNADVLKFKRVTPQPMPGLLARFPSIVDDIESRIDACGERDPWLYPPTASELVCVHTYGKCGGYELCQLGKAP